MFFRNHPLWGPWLAMVNHGSSDSCKKRKKQAHLLWMISQVHCALLNQYIISHIYCIQPLSTYPYPQSLWFPMLSHGSPCFPTLPHGFPMVPDGSLWFPMKHLNFTHGTTPAPATITTEFKTPSCNCRILAISWVKFETPNRLMVISSHWRTNHQILMIVDDG